MGEWFFAKARAKLNLTLDIMSRRPDGYHDIESVMCTVALADEIAMRLSGPPGIRLKVQGAALPEDERNLAYRAVSAFLDEATPKMAISGNGVEMILSKVVPSRAGLGGGSSDAAAALKLINRLLGSPVEECGLFRLARSLGSDVPFLIEGGAALVKGAGDDIRQLRRSMADEQAQGLPVVIVKPREGLSTASMYKAWDDLVKDARREGHVTGTRRFMERLSREGVLGALTELHNDFERVAASVVPEVGSIKGLLLDRGAASASMSGSGTAVFGIFLDTAKAEKARREAAAAHPGAFAALTELDLSCATE